MQKLGILIFLIAPFLSISQPTEEQIQQVAEAKKEVKKMKGKSFPDFTLTTLDGTSYILHKGGT